MKRKFSNLIIRNLKIVMIFVCLCLKKVTEGIKKTFTNIFNLLFQAFVFPDKMKTVKIIPQLKSGNRHHFTNYKHVSLILQFSKTLENLFCKSMPVSKGLTLNHYYHY